MYWLIFLITGLLSYATTGASITFSRWRGILDYPNFRSSHSVPMPRLGGTGIWLGFLACAMFLGSLAPSETWGIGPSAHQAPVIIVVSVGVALIGLGDDLFGLSFVVKLLTQLACSLAACGFGLCFAVPSVPGLGPSGAVWLGWAVTALWLVTLINVYNFMDGINGMAAGTALVYSSFFFLISNRTQDVLATALVVAVAGGCAGFVLCNVPRTRTFIGDTGSLFLGAIFGLMAVRLSRPGETGIPATALILICSVFLFDAGFTLARRILRGENIFRAHRQHLYQRLVDAGFSHARITGLYILLHVLMGFLALAYVGGSQAVRFSILAFAPLVFVGLALGVARVERSAARAASASTERQPG